MSFLRNLSFWGLGAAAASAPIGVLSSYSYLQSTKLPVEKRGSLLERTREASAALCRFNESNSPKSMREHVFLGILNRVSVTPKFVSSPKSTLYHMKTISRLPSKDSMKPSEDSVELTTEMETPNFSQYVEMLKLQKDGVQSSSTSPLIFSMKEIKEWGRASGPRHYLYRQFSPQTNEKFTLEGTLSTISSLKIRESLVSGDYTRCPSAVWVENPQQSGYHKIDALVLTKNASSCTELARHIIYGTALRGAGINLSHPKLNPNDPDAAIPVVDSPAKLASLPSSLALRIRSCDFGVLGAGTPSPSVFVLRPIPVDEEGRR